MKYKNYIEKFLLSNCWLLVMYITFKIKLVLPSNTNFIKIFECCLATIISHPHIFLLFQTPRLDIHDHNPNDLKEIKFRLKVDDMMFILWLQNVSMYVSYCLKAITSKYTIWWTFYSMYDILSKVRYCQWLIKIHNCYMTNNYFVMCFKKIEKSISRNM